MSKKEIVFGTLQNHVIETDGVKSFDLPRKELINVCYDALVDAGIEKTDIKTNLIPSYIQMARMELLQGRSAYTHHKYKSKKSSSDTESDSVEVSIPEDAQWMVAVGETVEYFRTRKEGQAFAKANDIMVKEVVKISA